MMTQVPKSSYCQCLTVIKNTAGHFKCLFTPITPRTISFWRKFYTPLQVLFPCPQNVTSFLHCFPIFSHVHLTALQNTVASYSFSVTQNVCCQETDDTTYTEYASGQALRKKNVSNMFNCVTASFQQNS